MTFLSHHRWLYCTLTGIPDRLCKTIAAYSQQYRFSSPIFVLLFLYRFHQNSNFYCISVCGWPQFTVVDVDGRLITKMWRSSCRLCLVYRDETHIKKWLVLWLWVSGALYHSRSYFHPAHTTLLTSVTSDIWVNMHTPNGLEKTTKWPHTETYWNNNTKHGQLYVLEAKMDIFFFTGEELLCNDLSCM